MSIRLGVNIDHVATLRQARYALMPEAHNIEPDLIGAASACERGGAHGITVHLRADRRHVQDRDVERLRESVVSNLNLELGNTPEIVDFALRVLPDDACLVPENRDEITTEGGLDVVAHRVALAKTIARFHSAGVRVSLFIDPEAAQVETARELGVEMVELHTGAYANALGEARTREFERLCRSAKLAHQAGIQVNAGHGINYDNVQEVRTLPHAAEFNIGHSLVSRALLVGLETATREMLACMAGG